MPTTRHLWGDETDTVVMEKNGAGATQAVDHSDPVPYGRLFSMRRGGKTHEYGYDAPRQHAGADGRDGPDDRHPEKVRVLLLCICCSGAVAIGCSAENPHCPPPGEVTRVVVDRYGVAERRDIELTKEESRALVRLIGDQEWDPDAPKMACIGEFWVETIDGRRMRLLIYVYGLEGPEEPIWSRMGSDHMYQGGHVKDLIPILGDPFEERSEGSVEE